MDECLTMLDQAKECQNDTILVRIVRLQYIAEKMAAGMPSEGRMGPFEHIAGTQLLHSDFQDLKLRLIAEPEPSGNLLCTNYIRIHSY